MNHIKAKVHDFKLDDLASFLDALPSLHLGGLRGLEVTFNFAEPRTTPYVVDQEAFIRWANTVARREEDAKVVYLVDVDWSRYTLTTFEAIDHAIFGFYLSTGARNAALEVRAIDGVMIRTTLDHRIQERIQERAGQVGGVKGGSA